MRGSWQRALGVGGASLALLAAPIIGVPGPAWAEPTAPDAAAAPTDPVVPTTPPAAPTTGPVAPAPNPATSPSTVDPTVAPTPGSRKPKGCLGITPRKPWRLVASRPDASTSAVEVEWSPVGCTTGYRVTVTGTGVDRQFEITGGSTSSVVIPDLAPGLSYSITVTSVGANGDGGVSGGFRLHHSGESAKSELTIDFPDAGPTEPVMASPAGTGPWVNPQLAWTAPVGSDPRSYRIKVTRSGGATVVEDTVPGTATTVRLGDAVAAGVPYTVTVTPVLADGTDGHASRLTFGDRQAPRPEQVTGNAPVVQFSPVTDVKEGRVLGYESASGRCRHQRRVRHSPLRCGLERSMGGRGPLVRRGGRIRDVGANGEDGRGRPNHHDLGQVGMDVCSDDHPLRGGDG
jgi:hypothetical protein